MIINTKLDIFLFIHYLNQIKALITDITFILPDQVGISKVCLYQDKSLIESLVQVMMSNIFKNQRIVKKPMVVH